MVDVLSNIISSYKDHHLTKKLVKYKTIIVFGPGHDANLCRGVLEDRGIATTYFCDLDSAKWGTFINGIKVLSPSELLKFNADDAFICVASSRATQVFCKLNELGIKDYANLSGISANTVNAFDPNYILDNIDDIRKAYDLMEDEESKDTFLSLIDYRLTMNFPFHVWNESFKQYYHPLVRPEISDIIIDGGARIGDTALSFSSFLDKKCTIYSFEPETRNFQTMLHLLDENNLEAIVKPFQVGLYEKNGEALFSVSPDIENSGAHHIAEYGDVLIKVVNLDWFAQNEKVIPNLIKLDVEGAELKVLMGATEIISHYRPKLTISVYHGFTDLWRIPLFIANLNLGYKLFLTQHNPEPTETILYALPSQQ